MYQQEEIVPPAPMNKSGGQDQGMTVEQPKSPLKISIQKQRGLSTSATLFVPNQHQHQHQHQQQQYQQEHQQLPPPVYTNNNNFQQHHHHHQRYQQHHEQHQQSGLPPFSTSAAAFQHPANGQPTANPFQFQHPPAPQLIFGSPQSQRRGGGHPQQHLHQLKSSADKMAADYGKLFVGQVPALATEDMLFPLFAPYGNLLEITIMRDNHGRSKGCAWIKYETQAQAQAAIDALHDQHTIPPQTNLLIVRYANNNLVPGGGRGGGGDMTVGGGGRGRQDF